MRILRKIFKALIILVSIPLLYLLVAIILTYIPLNTKSVSIQSTNYIYVASNGIHLDIVLAVRDLTPELKQNLKLSSKTRYLSFGWGDKDFYLNTPEWSDLSFHNGFKALFLESETLIHVSRYRNTQSSWKKIRASPKQLNAINKYLQEYFLLDQSGKKSILVGKGYTYTDDFYEAKGNYSCFNTCNTWVNSALKTANLKACLWTPFDFRVIQLHSP